MSIASAISNAQTKVANAYTAVSNKGGTLPATQNLSNLPTAINSIPTESTPTLITKSITSNGVYNASSDNADGYSSVTVNVSGGITNINNNYIIKTNGDIELLKKGNFTLGKDDSSISGDDLLSSAYRGNSTVEKVILRTLSSVNGNKVLYRCFYECSANLTSADLSSLTSVSGTSALQQMFRSCFNLEEIILSSLTSVYGSNVCYNMFTSDIKLTTVDFLKLKTIDAEQAFARCFMGCTALADVYFRALTTSSFGSYANQFNGMLSNTGTTVTHTLHFPSNLQSTISRLTGYPLFGGTSGYVVCAFDLPATS